MKQAMPDNAHQYDVIVVGSGPVGAVLTAELLTEDPSLTVCIVERGPVVGAPPGENLKNVADAQRRAELQRRCQGPTPHFYGISSLADRARATTRPDLANPDTLTRPGTFLLSADGVDAHEMPAASASRNVGGMGAHWTCACPRPAAAEIVPELRSEWGELIADAEAWLGVNSDAYARTPLLDEIARHLQPLVPSHADPSRRPRSLPMAMRGVGAARAWVGPADVLEHWRDDPRLTLLADALVTRVEMSGPRATGVQVRRTPNGRTESLRARAVVVAAGAFHTPQLLWASDLDLPALGRYLNEHAQVISGARLTDLSGGRSTSSDPVSGVLWVPYSDDFPFHAQVTSVDASPIRAHDLDGGATVTLSWFVPTEIDADHRVERIPGSSDAYGLPAMRIHFSRSAEDLRRAADAARMQAELAEALGGPVDERGPVLMPPGSSLHYAGTVRIGSDAATSVCSPRGRVWGSRNLYVAGTGTISTAVAGNPTLAAAAIAVGTAREITRELSATPL